MVATLQDKTGIFILVVEAHALQAQGGRAVNS